MARTRINSSVRGEKTLADLGVLRAFERGDRCLLVGPVYELRKEPGTELRLFFERTTDGGIEIGYARRSEGGDWETVESEPYTLRSFGYWERRLKRIGDYLRNEPPLGLV